MLPHAHGEIQLDSCLQSIAQHLLQGKISVGFACAHLCINDLGEAWCGLQCLTGAPHLFPMGPGVQSDRSQSCVSDKKGKVYNQEENSYHETALVLFVLYLLKIT